MTRHKPHHVRMRTDGRYRVFVDYKYYGTYATLNEATHAADDAVLARELESDNNIGRWPLNHPQEHHPTSLRRILFAKQRGDWYHLYGQYLGDDSPLSVVKQNAPPVQVTSITKIPISDDDIQIERFTKKYKRTYADAEDVDVLLPDGLSEWLEIGKSVDWDMGDAMTTVADRSR